MAARTVQPGGPLRGDLEVPGDKSQTHRAVMLGALAGGPCRIRRPLRAADTRCTRSVMEACGAEVVDEGDDWVVHPPSELAEPADVLDCGNSGTSIRLLAGLLAGLPDRFFVLTGDASLRGRPMGRVITPLRAMGAHVWARDGDTRAPIAIRGQALQPTHHDLALASAQLKSALLFAGLRCGVTLTQPAESRDHTERMFRALGAPLRTDGRRIELDPTEGFPAFDWTVPGDLSSTAFWLVAASVREGSSLRVRNVGLNPTRAGVIDVLEAMGADLQVTRTHHDPEPRGDIEVRHAGLRGTTIAGDLTLRALDEIPALAVAAAFAEGTTTISDASELRGKESDRLARVEAGLRAMGVSVEPRPDGLVIEGRPPEGFSALAPIDARGDHRIAMAFAVAGHAAGGVVIDGAEEVGSSYPTFFDDLTRLAAG